jgi:dTMP kinase
MKGLFITFEGPDGSGKTTQIKMLKDYLENKGFEVILTREPGGTELGEDIRRILLDLKHKDMDEKAEMLLYAAARAQHVSKLIKPALLEGKIVLCDRFVDSSYAYQGAGRGLGIKLVEQVNEIALSGVYPDLTIFLNIEPTIGLLRSASSKGLPDRLESEKIGFHEKVREGFVRVCEQNQNRIKEADAGDSVEQVFKTVAEHVNYLIGQKNNI